MFRRQSRDVKRCNEILRVYLCGNIIMCVCIEVLICCFVSEPHSSNPLKIAVKLFSLSMEVKVHCICMPCSVFGTHGCSWGNLLTNWRWEFRKSSQSRLKRRQTKPRRSRPCRHLHFNYNYKGSQTATLLNAIYVFMMLGKKHCASSSLMSMWCSFAQICNLLYRRVCADGHREKKHRNCKCSRPAGTSSLLPSASLSSTPYPQVDGFLRASSYCTDIEILENSKLRAISNSVRMKLFWARAKRAQRWVTVKRASRRLDLFQRRKSSDLTTILGLVGLCIRMKRRLQTRQPFSHPSSRSV